MKRCIHDEGISTFIADGESRHADEDEFTAVVRDGGIDVVQFDFRRCPITPWLHYMPVIRETGCLAAPHNWGSNLLNYYITQFERGCGRFGLGETDRSVVPEISAEGYSFVNGCLAPPDVPGFGLELDTEGYRKAQDRDGSWSVS